MPMYEFICQSCGHRFEVLTSYSRKGEVRCPQCDAPALKEVMGLVVGGHSSPGGAPAPRPPFT